MTQHLDLNHDTDNLRHWCRNHRISTNDLAESLGCSYQSAFRLINGDLPVSEKVAGRILMRFGPSAAAEILGGGKTA